MKKYILPWVLALALLLTSGCASLLDRSYMSSVAHVDRPTTAEDPSILRVENYRELVSAVLYLVSQGAEQGTIQLHDYTGSVDEDLTAACLEVATQDPLGAYCVDYIKHEFSRVVSYYQATLDIHYRRTMEQVRSIVRVTGTGAIRTELREALAQFAPQVVLRVAYFSEDEASMESLIRQAYYDSPATALGMPQMEIGLYPDSGQERVVEILLTYPEPVEKLRKKSEDLAQRREEMLSKDFAQTAAVSLVSAPERVRQTLSVLWSAAVYAADGGATAYDALVNGVADDEGMALAYALLWNQRDRSCQIVEGSRDGIPRFWVSLSLTGQVLFLDPSEGTGRVYTTQELFDQGYRWEGGPAEPEEEAEEEPEGEAQAEPEG